jgi:hypothetical protein
VDQADHLNGAELPRLLPDTDLWRPWLRNVQFPYRQEVFTYSSHGFVCVEIFIENAIATAHKY